MTFCINYARERVNIIIYNSHLCCNTVVFPFIGKYFQNVKTAERAISSASLLSENKSW